MYRMLVGLSSTTVVVTAYPRHQPIPSSNPLPYPPGSMEFQATAMVYGVAAMTIGILFLFFGIRLFRTVLATTGFIFGALLAFILVANIREQYSWGPNGDLYTLTVCIAIGALGAVLGLSVWMLSLVGIGALGGFGAALYLLSWKGDELATSPISRPIFLTVMTVLGGIFSIIYEKAIIILGTSIIGAVSLCSGVDVFTDTHFNDSIQEFLKNKAAFQLTTGTCTLLASCGIVALLGILIQSTITGRNSSAYSSKGY